MFKELYRRANNRIDTEEAYERLMKKIENAPQKKNIRKVAVRRMEYAAALAACLCITVAGVKVYDRDVKESPSEQIYRTVNQEESVTAPDIADKAAVPEETAVPEASAIPTAPAAENKKPEPAPRTAPVPTPHINTENKAQTDIAAAAIITPVPAENTAAETEAPSKAESAADSGKKENIQNFEYRKESQKENSDTKSEAADTADNAAEQPLMAAAYADAAITSGAGGSGASSGSSGGGSSPRSRSMEVHAVSLPEYYEYIGKRITMPEGYELASYSPEYFEMTAEGGFADDRLSLCYKKCSAEVRVTVSKDLSRVRHYLESYVRSDIPGAEAAIMSAGSDFSAYMICGEAAYEVTASGMNEEEFKNILSSLAD